MSREFPFWMSCFGCGCALVALVEGIVQHDDAIIITTATVLIFANVMLACLFAADM